MNIEVLAELEKIKKMITDGDEKVKKELKEYIKEQTKVKKAKTTKKDGD